MVPLNVNGPGLFARMRRTPGITSSTVSGARSNFLSNGMSALMRRSRKCRPAPTHWPARAAAARYGSAASLAELAPDDVFAAHVAGLLAQIERTGHGGTHPVRRRSRRSPTVRQGHHLLPIVRTLRNVGCVIELIELGRVFRDEAIGLDEIGEHIAAGPMPADAPFDVEPVLLDPAGAAHQAVDVRHLVSDVIERGAVVAEDRDAVMIRTAAQELHHVRAVGELEAEHVHEKPHLIVGACAVEDDVTDLCRP